MQSAWALAAECGFERLTNRPRPEWLEALAVNARVEVLDLKRMSYGPPDRAIGWFRGIEFPTSAFNRRGYPDRRVCPDCLAEKDHHWAI